MVRNQEAEATNLINGLTTIGASEECKGKVIPLLCLHLFGLCGESGVPIHPTRSECEEIRDETCQMVWNILLALDIDLPDCDLLPSESSSCPTLNDSASTNGTGMHFTSLIIFKNYNVNSFTFAIRCNTVMPLLKFVARLKQYKK